MFYKGGVTELKRVLDTGLDTLDDICYVVKISTCLKRFLIMVLLF